MTTSPSVSARCLAIAALALLGACAGGPDRRGPNLHGSSALSEDAYPGVLRPPEALVQDVVWQQRVTANWPDGERGFDAAVQKRGDTLTVIGLSPMGAMGFVFTLAGDTIEFSNQSGQDLPFPPRFILLDVQRVFYPWLGDGIGLRGHRDDGDHPAKVDGERIVETWRDGRIQRRTFERLDGEPAGVLTVDYTWGRSDWAAPTKAVLDNTWFGYRITVDTHAESLLPVGN